MKTLLILRHAKSSRENPNLTDHDRLLNDRGRRDAPRMGKLIWREALTPDLIISSTAVRASNTADGAAARCGYERKVQREGKLYLADPAGTVDVLRRVRDGAAATVMIVGHNPGLEQLVELLTGEEETLPAAALAQVALPIDRWRDLRLTTRGKLVNVWRPKELRR